MWSPCSIAAVMAIALPSSSHGTAQLPDGARRLLSRWTVDLLRTGIIRVTD